MSTQAKQAPKRLLGNETLLPPPPLPHIVLCPSTSSWLTSLQAEPSGQIKLRDSSLCGSAAVKLIKHKVNEQLNEEEDDEDDHSLIMEPVGARGRRRAEQTADKGRALKNSSAYKSFISC